MNEKLSPQTAYKAMYLFLQDYYKRTTSEEVAGMLGSMALLPDNSTADPAIWQDWLEAVEKSKSDIDISLKLQK